MPAGRKLCASGIIQLNTIGSIVSGIAILATPQICLLLRLTLRLMAMTMVPSLAQMGPATKNIMLANTPGNTSTTLSIEVKVLTNNTTVISLRQAKNLL